MEKSPRSEPSAEAACSRRASGRPPGPKNMLGINRKPEMPPMLARKGPAAIIALLPKVFETR